MGNTSSLFKSSSGASVQQTNATVTLSRIAFINPVLGFVTDDVREVLRLRRVSKAFQECIEDYGAEIWTTVANSLTRSRAQKKQHVDAADRYTGFSSNCIDDDVGGSLAGRRAAVSTKIILDCIRDGKNLWIVRNLFSQGQLSPNFKFEGGVTALYVAAASASMETTKFLLRAGADADESCFDDRVWFPMVAATDNGDIPMLELLLDHGAKDHTLTTLRSTFRPTALHRALALKDCTARTVRKLISAGSDLRMVDQRKNTALHLATSVACPCNDQLEIVRLLLRAGANSNLVNMFQKAPLHEACGCLVTAYDQIMKKNSSSFFASTAASPSSPENEELTKRADEIAAIVKALIDAGADIEQADRNGARPLHIAAQTDFFGCVAKVLIDAGCDINVVGPFGLGPAATAAKAGNVIVLKLLLEQGCDIDVDPAVVADKAISSWDSKNPLTMACTAAHANSVKAVLDSGYPKDERARNQCYRHLANKDFISIRKSVEGLWSV